MYMYLLHALPRAVLLTKFVINKNNNVLALRCKSDMYFQLSLAYQIFKIADMMTNNPTEFALYWTDIDYENIAVDNQGKVVIIDAENIIVVDKKKVEAGKLCVQVINS